MPRGAASEKLAILPLRAGSKGLPNKNLRPIAGKPLYRHTLDQALRTVGRCAITTDIPELLNGKIPEGCVAIERPAELAGDSTPINPVLTHLFDQLERVGELPGTVVLVQATSPLRLDDDVRAAIDLYERGDFELVMSVTSADSGILKYGYLDDGRFDAVARPEYCFENRQDLPKIVRPNGAVYVFSPEVFRRNGGLATKSIGAVEMPEDRSIDIDDEADMKAAEALLLRSAATPHREAV
jgi:CMP-N,N'-diacetyllegionaminic acid synthase